MSKINVKSYINQPYFIKPKKLRGGLTPKKISNQEYWLEIGSEEIPINPRTLVETNPTTSSCFAITKFVTKKDLKYIYYTIPNDSSKVSLDPQECYLWEMYYNRTMMSYLGLGEYLGYFEYGTNPSILKDEVKVFSGFAIAFFNLVRELNFENNTLWHEGYDWVSSCLYELINIDYDASIKNPGKVRMSKYFNDLYSYRKSCIQKYNRDWLGRYKDQPGSALNTLLVLAEEKAEPYCETDKEATDRKIFKENIYKLLTQAVENYIQAFEDKLFKFEKRTATDTEYLIYRSTPKGGKPKKTQISYLQDSETGRWYWAQETKK